MLRKSFVPQQKNRCYCTSNCNCKPDDWKNIPYSESGTSFRRILNNSPKSESSSSKSNFTPDDSYTAMTEWRQVYERSSSQLSNYYTKAEDLQFEDLPAKFLSMKDQELVALREFRLHNSKECFSEDSTLPLAQKMERQNHQCEYSYKINDRGLLEPRLQTNDGRDVCRICKKPSDIPSTYKVGINKKSTPIIPSLRGDHNGKIVIDDDRAKELGKKNYLPRSRLSLNHRKWNK